MAIPQNPFNKSSQTPDPRTFRRSRLGNHDLTSYHRSRSQIQSTSIVQISIFILAHVFVLKLGVWRVWELACVEVLAKKRLAPRHAMLRLLVGLLRS
jgi:hypothetical protein